MPYRIQLTRTVAEKITNYHPDVKKRITVYMVGQRRDIYELLSEALRKK